jgi:hypothetical protein
MDPDICRVRLPDQTGDSLTERKGYEATDEHFLVKVSPIQPLFDLDETVHTAGWPDMLTG